MMMRGARRPLGLLLLGFGLLLAGALALVAWMDRPAASPALRLTYSTEAGPDVQTGVVDSPLHVQLQLPPSAAQASPTPIAIELILLDADGQPALFGPQAAAPLPMRWAGSGGAWEWRGSVPSRPGAYHARLQLYAQANTLPTVIDLPAPQLQASAETGAPLRTGYVFPVEADLWLLQTNTARVRRLTFFPSTDASASGPAWAPDGRQIAFVYAAPPTADGLSQTAIWSVQPDGANLRPLVVPAPDESLLAPTWAADGHTLYFSVDKRITGMVAPGTDLSDNRRIDRVDLTTGGRTVWQRAAQGPAAGGPHGDLVYLEDVPAPDVGGQPGQRLVRQAADGTGRRVLVEAFTYPRMEAARLSPGGQWVVFAMSQGPVPSQDGKRLDLWAWLRPPPVAAHGSPWDLYLVPAEGGRVQRLTTLNEDDPTPVWLNNSTLAFMGSKNLYTLNLDERGTPIAPPSTLYPGSPHGGLSWQGP